jgi:hypothetical protein
VADVRAALSLIEEVRDACLSSIHGVVELWAASRSVRPPKASPRAPDCAGVEIAAGAPASMLLGLP